MTIETVETSYDQDSATQAILDNWGIKDEEEGGESLPDATDDAKVEGKDEASTGTDDESQKAEDGDEKDDDGDQDADGAEVENEDDAEKDDGEEQDEGTPVADDAKVTVEVNGESKEFSVGDLKRLAGQEASLTQKSQAVAEQRKQYEANLTAQRAALEAMVKRASDRFEPYKDFDFNLAAQQYDAETYKALRDDAQAAYADVNFYQNELSGLLAAQDTARQAALQESAAAAVKALRDETTGIKGFNRTMFMEMRDYAVSTGIPADNVDEMTDPVAWKIIHKAMQFDSLQKAKTAAKPVKPKVTKVVKQGKTTPARSNSAEQARKAQMKRISSTQGMESIEAAAEALLSQWSS